MKIFRGFASQCLSCWLASAGARGSRRTIRGADREAVRRTFTSILLGTDDLGRDRFSRCCTDAGLTLLARSGIDIGDAGGFDRGVAGFAAGAGNDSPCGLTDLVLSLRGCSYDTVRAALPLNTSWTSVSSRFASLARWGGGDISLLARPGAVSEILIMCCWHKLQDSDACAFFRHTAQLRSVLLAQFWLAIPVFIIAERTLVCLDWRDWPLPSWGGMLRELEVTPRCDTSHGALFTVLLVLAVERGQNRKYAVLFPS